jgi:diguanylate cyclase (GGDEF)-like protein
MSLASKDDLLDGWRATCDAVDFAFQPVVSTFTGQAVAFEALLRGSKDVGFTSIAQFFDTAARDGVILEVNLMLLIRAAAAFHHRILSLPEAEVSDVRLYFNIDNRVFDHDDASEALLRTLGQTTLPPDHLTLEISERNILPEKAHSPEQLPRLRSQGVSIALDDFGSGYSGLQMLYQAGSDTIKIDRFFISHVHKDPTKRIFITNLVSMAHAMGLHVVAEGVESSGEYYVCREIGCDTIQGYLIARPSRNAEDYRLHYPVIDELVAKDRRRNTTAGQLLKERIRRISAIVEGTPILDVLQRFRSERETTFLPVVNGRNEPIGILREHDLKEYVYSPFGISLLMNRSYGDEPYRYMRRVPVVPAHSRIDRVLELAAMETVAEALIITENGQYLGCLDSRALLQILHERELTFAREQNPLTRLPGNAKIAERMADIGRPSRRWTAVTYLDFDSFKPFNDTYGFRVGDRVIQLFADLLRTSGVATRDFVGHVGGDDYLLVAKRHRRELVDHLAELQDLLDRFSQDVQSFYTPEDRAAGGITAIDRDDVSRHFPLLTASAAVVFVPPREHTVATAGLSHLLSQAKHWAKHSPGAVTAVSILPNSPPA